MHIIMFTYLVISIAFSVFALAENAKTKSPRAISSPQAPTEQATTISNTNTEDAISKFISDFNTGKGNEDATMSIDSIITKYGYKVEKHDATTEDHYVITMFRIPGNGSVVFLMHGLLGSADDFILAGCGSGLAYVLADQGYDVWLGNARGNKHSRRHATINPSNSSFWDFSWHEIGVYDLPAMIDSVLNITSRESLKYIGYSQGTTAFFVMTSERPEYNEKISLMIALSPVAFLTKVRSPIVRFLIKRTSSVEKLSNRFGINEILPDTQLLRSLKLLTCGSGALGTILCSNIVFLVAGYDFGQLNVTNLPFIFGHIPSSASLKQFYHYGQIIISKEFRQYDYGALDNMRRYGEAVPPRYKLDKIVAPIYLFYSGADWLAHPDDVEHLRSQLTNVVGSYKIPYDHFNHIDFITARDVKSLVYRRLLKMLLLY